MSDVGPLPDWVAEGIRTARVDEQLTVEGTGRVLDVYPEYFRMSVRMDEAVADGTRTVTMEMPPDMDAASVRNGTAYCLVFEQSRVMLGREVAEFLRTEGLDIKSVYRFRLRGIRPVQVGTAAGLRRQSGA